MLEFASARLGYSSTGTLRREVIAPLSFCVGANKILGIVGPSGVGKTTVLRAAAGVLSPFDGMIRLDPERCQPANNSALHWLLPQSPVLLPFRTGIQNALFAREIDRQLDDSDVSAANQILKDLGLGEAQEQRPDQMSGGMRRRIALAQALMSDRRVLLLDEPLAEIDFNTRLLVECVIEAYGRSEHRLCVIASHDVDSIAAVADYALILHGPSPARATYVSLSEAPFHLAGPSQERRSGERFVEGVARLQKMLWAQQDA